ncbi:MAG: AAA family ATPase [Flavobacteriales bacterium]|nr:AAA family ATPase [Flavobacteriales bacterium]
MPTPSFLPISRIAKIRGHRIFREFTWPSTLHDFGRFNLIYGWNGSGKSTLCHLFEHVADHQPVTEGQVEFVINGHPVQGSALDTAANLPNLRVFNREAVVRTISEASSPLGPIYYFGEVNVETQKQLDSDSKLLVKAKEDLEKTQQSAKGQASALSTFCSDKAKVIKDLLAGPGSGYTTYTKNNFERKCAELIERVGPLPTRTADERAALNQKKSGSSLPSLPELETEYPDLVKALEITLDLLARTVTSNIIARLEEEPRVAKWVEEGLEIHGGEAPTSTCEFCGNEISAARREALEGHFNDAYKSFLLELDKAKSACEHHVKALTGLNRHDPAKLYSTLQQSYGLKLNKLNEEEAKVRAYLTALNAALSAKALSPFQSLDIASFMVGQDEMSHDSSVAALRDLNKSIKEHNETTASFEKGVAAARKELEEAQVADALDGYKKLVKALNAADADEKRLTEEVKTLGERVMKLELELKGHRKPAEELNGDLRSFLGRNDLQVDVLDTGYTIIRNGVAALNLSEGEKTAIAFLYFLKSLRDTAFDLGKGVVVIDDPVSSLDAHALFSAFGHMREVTKDAGQLFILTHNFGFFRQVKRWFHKMQGQKRPDVSLRPARLFMLSTNIEPAGRNGSIVNLDTLLERFESEYHFLFKQLHEEAERVTLPPDLAVLYPLPNIARRVLETFLAFKYPSLSSDGLQKMLEAVPFDAAKKIRIHRFTDSYSHSDRIDDHGMDMTLLSEAPQIMREILELIKATDEQHFDGMMEQFTAGAAA